MGVDRSAGFARPAQVEGLAIRGSPVSLPKPGGDRLGVDGVGQTGERRPKGFLAHVPCLHAQQRARSEEHTSELQSLLRISYAVFCLKKKKPDGQTLTRQTTAYTQLRVNKTTHHKSSNHIT